MSEHENNDLGAFLAGFVIGGLVGAATALILAPQSGQDTRSQIAMKGNELRDASGERLHQYRDTASTFVADTRHRAEETGSHFQEQARIVLDTGKEKVSSVATAVEEHLPLKKTGEPSADVTDVADIAEEGEDDATQA